MAGGNSGNLRIVDRCYRYIQENGEQTVSELKEYLRSIQTTTIKGSRKSPHGATSEQLANVLRCSPLFKVSGTTTIRYGQSGGVYAEVSKTSSVSGAYHTGKTRSKVSERKGQDTKVNLYDIVPIEDIIEKLRGKEHLVRKRWPKVLKDAMKKEGII